MDLNILNIDETEIMERYDVDHLSAKLLKAANLSDNQIKDILSNDMQLHTSNAQCVLDCVNRILQAKENNEKVFVGGDYDADGICATAIMKKTLDILGIENGFYIPDRFKEGYGLHPETVELAYEKGYTLILTVDNGVKALDAISKAKELGVDIIITDHHTISDELDVLVVHPDYMEEEFQYLSGAGVALEISRHLVGNMDALNAIAGVAQVGDVMQLYAETRKLVKIAIESLKQHNPLPLFALFSNKDNINHKAIAFDIVPKLNSVGRLNEYANVNTVPQFLISDNEVDIMKYATQITHVNELRKSLSKKEVDIANSFIKNDKFHVVYDPSFHEGLCGLVAGRITQSTQKPTLVLSKHNDLLKGSARSIPGINLMDFFQDMPYIEQIGGHEMAAGLAIKEENYDQFYEIVQEKIASYQIDMEDIKPIAIHITPKDISLEAIMDLYRLEPMPKEISEIQFALEDFTIIDIFQSPKVTKYILACDACELEAICFSWKNLPKIEHPNTLIGKLQINRWRDKVVAQMEIDDIH